MTDHYNEEIESRVYAISDLHVDYAQNMAWVMSLGKQRYLNDVLIVAGDVSDDLGRLEQTLASLRERFSRVYFVSGNHEFWLRRDDCADSWEKFQRIERLCRRLNVGIEPERVLTEADPGAVWIVPMHSWYVRPEEGEGSLFVGKEGEDHTLSMWADNYLVRWPALPGDQRPPAHRLLDLNKPHLRRNLDAPIISFSHFLPRRDLIFSSEAEAAANPRLRKDEFPTFNFTRVAGCEQLDIQIRQLGSSIHIYGHQHRNRHREVDGVLYISNCLGYPRDRNLEADPHDALIRVR